MLNFIVLFNVKFKMSAVYEYIKKDELMQQRTRCANAFYKLQ